MQIKEIAEKLGIKLEELKEQATLEAVVASRNSYLCNDKKDVIGLNLSKSKLIDEKVVFIWQIKEIQALNLSENQLSVVSIPESLSALQFLDLSENKLLKMLTFEAGLPSLKKLELSECDLVSLNFPKGFEALDTLYAQDNQLTNFVIEGDCPNLRVLDLSGNKIETVSFPAGLPSLELLYLQGGNKIKDLSFLSETKSLQTLNLQGNTVSDISPLHHLLEKIPFKWKKSGSGVLLEDCPLITPPPEIVKEGNDAILRHLNRLQKARKKEYLYEAKVLLIGKTGAGKTSLRYKLRDVDEVMPDEDESTKGIDIETIKFELENGATFNMNVWDFEGQQISHQTHQFFLTKRSFYLFVADQRTEKPDFDAHV